MRIPGLPGDPDTVVEPIASLLGATCLKQKLGGHLIGGNVLWRVREDRFVLCQGLIMVSVRSVGHGQPVPRKRICRVLFKDLGECSNLVHASKMTAAAVALQAGS